MTDPRRGRWLRRAALMLFGLLAAPFALEGVLRLFDPIGFAYVTDFETYRSRCLRLVRGSDGAIDPNKRLFEHRPSSVAAMRTHRVEINALGFRGPEVTIARRPGMERVVVLGDSIAFGWGVDDPYTFVRRWETDRRARDLPTEIINLGVPAYDTSQEADLFLDRGRELRPDLVILVYVVNDVDSTRTRYLEFLGIPSHATAPDVQEVPTGISPFAGWFPRTALVLRRTGWIAPEADENLLRLYASEQDPDWHEGWRSSRDALRTIRDACASIGARLVLLDHTRPRLRWLPDTCEQEGVPYRRFALDDVEAPSRYRLAMADPHPNEAGHELLFERLVAIFGGGSVVDPLVPSAPLEAR